jgi:hypothetical protein
VRVAARAIEKMKPDDSPSDEISSNSELAISGADV